MSKLGENGKVRREFREEVFKVIDKCIDELEKAREHYEDNMNGKEVSELSYAIQTLKYVRWRIKWIPLGLD